MNLLILLDKRSGFGGMIAFLCGIWLSRELTALNAGEVVHQFSRSPPRGRPTEGGVTWVIERDWPKVALPGLGLSYCSKIGFDVYYLFGGAEKMAERGEIQGTEGRFCASSIVGGEASAGRKSFGE